MTAAGHPGTDPSARGVVLRTGLAGIPSYLCGTRYRAVGHGAIGSGPGLTYAWLLAAGAVFVAPLGPVALVFVARAGLARRWARAVAAGCAAAGTALGMVLPGHLGLV